MVKGRSYLTPEFILSHISEYDIYRYYSGVDFKVNRAFNSPFRNDPVPSFIIGNKYGPLSHMDFGDSNYRGNCFDFVSQITKLPYQDALHRIAVDFGIKKGTPRTVPTYKQPRIKAYDGFTEIKVKPKAFTLKGLEYWNEYTIDISELQNENIYEIDKLYINKKRFPLPKDEPVFGYLYNDKYWKIYRPFAKNKKDKWRSNVPIDTCDGLGNIVKAPKSLVTKSKKDKLVIRKIFPPTCHVQNESLVALSTTTVEYLRENSQEIYLNYDGDQPGKSNSWAVTKEFGFKHINVPDGYVKKGIKDFSDLCKERGLERVIAHFKRKGLL